MTDRLSLAGMLLGALTLILTVAISHPGLNAGNGSLADPSGASLDASPKTVPSIGGSRHYTVDEPECVMDDNGTPAADVPNRAMNCSDQFAWRLWAKINAADENENPAWVHWATDHSTFPAKPRPSACTGEADPDHCPVFRPTGGDIADSLTATLSGGETLGFMMPSKRPAPLHTAQSRQRALAMLAEGEIPNDLGSATYETVHRNRAAFDYIVDHDLWYEQGLAQAFEQSLRVDFPQASIEIKTNWLDLSSLDRVDQLKEAYYVIETESSVWALMAMHITTKDLPQWFWATFEHKDNPGRCDFIGCHDSYAQVPADIEPAAVLDEPYAAGDLRPYVTGTLLADLPEVLRENYRLKGTQTTFTLPTGEPTLLGNSVTEHGFVQTSSCMTCHARAAFDYKGETPYFFGGRPNGQSFNGAPDPDWFFGTQDQTQTFMRPGDFVWALARAQPICTEKQERQGACSSASE